MAWKPYTEEDKQEALVLSRDRLLELRRADTGELLTILTKYYQADAVNWSEAAMEVHRALGDVRAADAELAWALLPFMVRSNDIRGGSAR